MDAKEYLLLTRKHCSETKCTKCYLYHKNSCYGRKPLHGMDDEDLDTLLTFAEELKTRQAVKEILDSVCKSETIND